MKRSYIFTLLLLFLSLTVTPSFAHAGCCSQHGGVSGCECADGTPLSNTCLPYYPACNGGGSTQQSLPQPSQQQQNDTAPPASVPTSVPVVDATNIPIPTLTAIPTATHTPTTEKKVVKKTVKHTAAVPTPTQQPQGNFFSWILGLFFGQQPTTGNNTSSAQNTPVSTSTMGSAGVEIANSQCKSVHINATDPQAYVPDANCTPGIINTAVTQTTIYSTICVSGYTKTIRPPASYTNQLKREQMQEYGYTDT